MLHEENLEFYQLPVYARVLYEARLIRLNNRVYQGERKLKDYVGNAVNVRYDSNNSSVIRVYVQEGDREVFIANAHLISDNSLLFCNRIGNPESYSLIFEYVLNHPEWRTSLQTHKFANIR